MIHVLAILGIITYAGVQEHPEEVAAAKAFVTENFNIVKTVDETDSDDMYTVTAFGKSFDAEIVPSYETNE